MKPSYKILLVFLFAFFAVDAAYAQSKNTKEKGSIRHDTCAFYVYGQMHLDYGRSNIHDGFYTASLSDFKNAIQCFNLHRIEHPQDETTLAYLDTIYGYYALLENDNGDENLKTTLSNLPYVKRIGEFLRRFDALAVYSGIPLSETGRDYCSIFQEVEEAIGYYDNDFNTNPTLFAAYKYLVYYHANLLLYSYLNSECSTLSFASNLFPEFGRCVGEQPLDRCFKDLNRLVNVNQPDSAKIQIDTLALVLLGECYYYNNELEKATDCYEKSGLTPEQLLQLRDYVSVSCFRDAYIIQGLFESEQVASLLDVLVDYWYEHYRMLYADQACYKDKEARKTGYLLNFAHIVMAYYFVNEEYEKALDFWFKIKNNFSLDPTLNCYQGWCRSALEDPSATEELEFAVHLNPKDMLTQFVFMANKVNQGVLPSNSPFGGTLSGDTLVCSMIDTTYYLLSGLSCYYEKDYASARDNFQMLGSTPTNNLFLAICYQKLAKEENDSKARIGLETMAEQYFREVIAEENSMGRFASAPYAYLFLHEDDKAVETMETILRTDLFTPALTEDDSILLYGVHYQAAEIYAGAGQLKKAKKHLELAFNYCHKPLVLAIAEKAPLLASIQGYVDGLIGQYNNQQVITLSPIHRDTIVCDIPYEKNGISNTRTIDCEINGVALKMLFDPGADYVQLSKKIADSIGISNTNDSIGWTPTRSANGIVVSQPLVSLNSVKIGDIELKNVQAVINSNPTAPLLLGCTVWNNLKVEMPSPKKKGMIRLTYIKETVDIPEKRMKTPLNHGTNETLW